MPLIIAFARSSALVRLRRFCLFREMSSASGNLGNAAVFLVLLRQTEAMIATALGGSPKAARSVTFDEAGVVDAVDTIASHLMSGWRP